MTPYIAEFSEPSEGGGGVRCPGCRRGTPFVTAGELMDITRPGAILRGLRPCLAMNGFHGSEEVIAGYREKAESSGRIQRTRDRSGAFPPPEGRDRPRKPGEPLEEEVRGGIRTNLISYGWEVHDFEQGYRLDRCPSCKEELGRGHATTRVPKGTADLLVTGHGFNFWIEVKRPGGALRSSQRAWHQKIRAGGGKVYILRDAEAAIHLSATIFINQELPPDGEYPATREE